MELFARFNQLGKKAIVVIALYPANFCVVGIAGDVALF